MRTICAQCVAILRLFCDVNENFNFLAIRHSFVNYVVNLIKTRETYGSYLAILFHNQIWQTFFETPASLQSFQRRLFNDGESCVSSEVLALLWQIFLRRDAINFADTISNFSIEKRLQKSTSSKNLKVGRRRQSIVRTPFGQYFFSPQNQSQLSAHSWWRLKDQINVVCCLFPNPPRDI